MKAFGKSKSNHAEAEAGNRDAHAGTRSVNELTVGDLREQLAEIDPDVKVNIVIGDCDDDQYSGWNGELFSWNRGEDYVILFGHVEDNMEASVREAYPENF